MSVAKTIALEIAGILSTQYARRNIANMRGAYQIEGDYQITEYMLDPNSTKNVNIPVEKFLMLATDGAQVTATLTDGSGSKTFAVDQMMLLTAPLTSFALNNLATSGNPVRVRAIYA